MNRGPSLRKDKSKKITPASWTIIAIITVILVLLFAFIFVSLIRDANAADVVQRCSPGLCKFDILSGIKVCPEAGDTEGIRVSPGAEFCTSRDYCQKNNFQCAVQLDQTIRCDGVCGPGNPECRCIQNPV